MFPASGTNNKNALNPEIKLVHNLILKPPLITKPSNGA